MRYFFDLYNDGSVERDEVGTDMPDRQTARKAAMEFLPDIARDEIPADGDRRTFTVVVREQNGEAVYSATLSYAGLMLKQ